MRIVVKSCVGITGARNGLRQVPPWAPVHRHPSEAVCSGESRISSWQIPPQTQSTRPHSGLRLCHIIACTLYSVLTELSRDPSSTISVKLISREGCTTVNYVIALEQLYTDAHLNQCSKTNPAFKSTASLPPTLAHPASTIRNSSPYGGQSPRVKLR